VSISTIAPRCSNAWIRDAVFLPDVNVLLYAHGADAPHHATCNAWLEAVINDHASFGVSELVLSGYPSRDAPEGLRQAERVAGSTDVCRAIPRPAEFGHGLSRGTPLRSFARCATTLA